MKVLSARMCGTAEMGVRNPTQISANGRLPSFLNRKERSRVK